MDVRWAVALGFGAGMAGCGEGGCEPAEAVPIEVTVTDQQSGEPVEGAVVELDQEACVEQGAGVYLCEATSAGMHHVLVLGGMAYAGAATMVDVPELGCAEDVQPVTAALTLLPAMAR